MKIQHLLSGMRLSLSNEESNFIEKYGDRVRLSALDEHGVWLAQNLVRKGAYSISSDDNTLVREVRHANN